MSTACICLIRWPRLHIVIDGERFKVGPTVEDTATSTLLRAWCGAEYTYPFGWSCPAGSGSSVPDDARWPLRWPDATGLVPLRPVADVVVARPGEPQRSASVLRYDTPHTVVAYVLRHANPAVVSPEAAAEAAARALTHDERESAIVLVAYSRSIGLSRRA